MPHAAMIEDEMLDVVNANSSNEGVKKKEWKDHEADCSIKCRSKADAANLIAGITRGTDQQSLAYLASSGICRNPGKVVDHLGRSLLHLAASTGKRSVAEWLIKYKAASLNSKDSESGYTPLHRALFYGHIHVARFLIECGANLALQDNDGLTPLEHVNEDHKIRNHSSVCTSTLNETPAQPTTNNAPPLTAGGLGEGYVWGTNANFNLGLGHQQQKNQPTLIDQLRRENVYISKVVLQKFHSAILTTQGNVLTPRHVQGGRLGHGYEDSHLSPRQIFTLKDHVCIDVALGIDHSMFLSANGTVWSCGYNASYLIGQK